MTGALNVGIIGCGNISSTYLQLAALFKTIKITAVADLNEEAANARAKEYGVAAKSVADLLADPGIDIIVNLTTPEAHFAVTRDILEANKHAYSEKPFVLSLKEGQALRELSAATGKTVCSAPDTYLGGTHQQARQLLDAGELGKITSGTCHLMSAGMEDWHPNPDFFFQSGAGPVLDMGPYYVANLINLIGPVARVSALANTPQSFRTIGAGPRKGAQVPVSTPTSVHAILEFENGALITLATSWDVKAHTHAHMELYGSKASLFLPDPNFFGGDLVMAFENGAQNIVPPWAHPLITPNQQHDEGMMANYRTVGLADMAQAIGENRAPRCALETSLHCVDILLSILKSAETGRAVSLSTTCSRPEPFDPDAARALLV